MPEPKHRTSSNRKHQKKKKRGAENRREALLDAAAKCFGKYGFAGTSTRDIGKQVGMLAGSIYYHFPSKNALLLAVHAKGVQHILDTVQQRLSEVGSDPWDRLEAACVGHLEALLGGSPYTPVVTPHFRAGLPAPLRRTLIKQRDSYESIFAELVDDLSLPPNTSRRYLRLALLGSLNWALTWYHKGGETPATIARHILLLYRLPLDKTLGANG